MLEQRQASTKERIAVLALWFAVLIGVRVLLGFVFESMWFGTIGAVAITFAIFYATLRYTRLQKYRQLINNTLTTWYRKKFFYISGALSMLVLASILGFIEYGHAYYADRLITVELNQQELESSFGALAASDELQANMVQNLQKYSPIEIIAITLASADKSLDGYYSKVVGFLFAEDIEIMIFMLLFRTRREIFAAPQEGAFYETVIGPVRAAARLVLAKMTVRKDR